MRDLDTARAMDAPTTQKSMRRSIQGANVPFTPISLAISPKSGLAVPSEYSKGGVVKKSGWAKLHKGERVLSRAAARVLGGKNKKTSKRKRRA